MNSLLKCYLTYLVCLFAGLQNMLPVGMPAVSTDQTLVFLNISWKSTTLEEHRKEGSVTLQQHKTAPSNSDSQQPRHIHSWTLGTWRTTVPGLGSLTVRYHLWWGCWLSPIKTFLHLVPRSEQYLSAEKTGIFHVIIIILFFNTT